VEVAAICRAFTELALFYGYALLMTIHQPHNMLHVQQIYRISLWFHMPKLLSSTTHFFFPAAASPPPPSFAAAAKEYLLAKLPIPWHDCETHLSPASPS
jgi:hypothetical protein